MNDSAWQPIATAPRDGREVLVALWNGLECAAFFDAGRWLRPVGDCALVECPQPTHWKPHNRETRDYD